MTPGIHVRPYARCHSVQIWLIANDRPSPFLAMHEDSGLDEATMLEKLFDNGNYDWVKDTPRVIRAVQKKYKVATCSAVSLMWPSLCGGI